jgi:hypothetical protein
MKEGMKARVILIGAVCCTAMAQQSSAAATFTLEPEADARVLNIPGSFQNANYDDDILSVYTAQGNEQRTFIRFDLSGIIPPAGERLSTAMLSMAARREFGDSEGLPMEVYRVTLPWTETGLTWNSRDIGTPWSIPGGEYVGQSGVRDSSPYAVSTANPNEGERVSWDITGLVEEWLDGVNPNHGMLLRSYSGNGLTFTQSESSASAFRPRLTVTFDPGPPRLQAELIGNGQVRISWAGINVGVLEENIAAASTGWTLTSAVPVVAEGRTQVTFQISGTRKFFRLKAQ